MNISKEQAEIVKSWVESGAGVADVQKRIENEFGVSMTYMDTRFLIDDIDAEIADAKDTSPEVPEPVEQVDASEAEFSQDDMAKAAEELNRDEIAGLESFSADNADSLEQDESQDSESSDDAHGKVRVSKDETPRAGTYASGSVTFSDGAQCEWFLDPRGQLGFVPSVVGYNPPTSDAQEFQRQLRELLGVPEEPDVDDSAINISVSALQRPDSIAFGDVTFSNGAKAEWRIDRVGQLVFIPADDSLKPPEEELPLFQRKLAKMLSKQY